MTEPSPWSGRPREHHDVAPTPYGTPPADYPSSADYPPAVRPSFDTPISAPVSMLPPGTGQPSPVPYPPAAGPAPGAADGHRAAPGGPRSRRRRAGSRAGLWVVSVLLVLALAGGTYVGYLAVRWADRSETWEEESRALGVEVAELTGDISGMTAELTTVRDQLVTAQTRITELADEKAQVGDDRENQKIIADDVQEIAETALDVATDLGDCVTAQNALLTLVLAPETTTPEAVQLAADRTETVCSAAIDDYNTLQDDLAAM